MEAQAILPVRTGGALKQESTSRGMNDIFEAILRENETRDSATRGEAARTDVSRERVDRDAERLASARRQSDAARETRDDGRYNTARDERHNIVRDEPHNIVRDERPEADDIQARGRSGHADETRPRAEHPENPERPERPGQGAETASDNAGTQERDSVQAAADTPVETGLGEEITPMAPNPAMAAGPALAGNPAIAAAPTAQAAIDAAPKPANAKDAVSNTPRPAIIPAAAMAGLRAAPNSAVATSEPGQAGSAAAPAAAKALEGALPAVPAEAGIPLIAGQVKKTQAPGQKAGAPTATVEANEIAGIPGKENQAPAGARIRLDATGHETAANSLSLVKGPAAPVAQSEANPGARANPAQVQAALENPGQQAPAVSDVTADALKTAAPAGNTGQAPAGATVIDPMQAATRAAGARPGPAPAMDRPVPPNEVAVNIQRAAARGEDRIRIRLHPAELGQVDVRLKVGADGIVRAMVQVDRQETLEFMQRDARGLERALQDAGLKTDSGSLSFNLRDNGEGGLRDRDGDGGTALAGREHADANSPDIAEAAEIPINNGGSSRVLDIRV